MMIDGIERTLDDLQHGRMTRREATLRLAGLVAAVAGTGGGTLVASEQRARTTFRGVGLNHVALRVTDVARSSRFYRERFGFRVLREGERNTFLACGGNQFLALFQGEAAGLDHFCFTIEGYRPKSAMERLRAAGHDPRRREDRVYFDDPDGLTVQVTGEWDDYPGERPR